MSAPFKNIAVIGAGGNLGPFIIQSLVNSGRFNVAVISRSSSAPPKLPSSVKLVKGEYTATFLEQSLKGHDALVITMSADAEVEQKRVIQAAVKTGVRRIFASEFGIDTADRVDFEPPTHKKKHEIMKFLNEQVSGTRTTWTSIICGPFFDWCLKRGLYGFDFTDQTVTLYDEGKPQFDTTTLSTVGDSVVAVLDKGPGKYENEFVFIRSFTTSQLQILSELEKVTGKRWNVKKHIVTEEFAAEGRRKIANGDASGGYMLLFAEIFAGRSSVYSKVRKLANQDLGLKEEDFPRTVEEVLKTDRHKVSF